MMKGTILLRVFFLLALVAGALSTHAQAYEFDCKMVDKYDDGELWQCEFWADISDDQFVRMDIKSMKDTRCFFSLSIGDLEDASFYTIFSGDEVKVQFHLSNGEVLSTNRAGGDREGVKLGAQQLRSSKPNTPNPFGSYAMQQLRRYNITKIVVDDDEFLTLGFRSAATIDAICKALIAHTGDQGQYGDAPASHGAATQKPATAVRPATSSLIASPALPKKMTEVQMVMHPFGVLKKDLKGYTYRQVEKDLKTLYNDYVDVWEETTIINVFRKDGKGYDMSYKGFIPIASCIFQEGRLYSYQYEFYFDRDVHTKASVEAMAKAFVSALKKDGISLPKNFSDDSYAVSGDYGSRSIIVAVHDIEDEPYKILINIGIEE